MAFMMFLKPREQCPSFLKNIYMFSPMSHFISWHLSEKSPCFLSYPSRHWSRSVVLSLFLLMFTVHSHQ